MKIVYCLKIGLWNQKKKVADILKEISISDLKITEFVRLKIAE